MLRAALVVPLAVAACGGKAVIDAEPGQGGGGSSAVTTTIATGGGGEAPPCPSCSDPETVGALGSPELVEVSGIATDAAGTFFVHNDSGDSGRFFRLADDGGLLTTYYLRVAPVDIEDIALGPCPGDRGSCIYLGDIGDNQASRASYAIYRTAAPATAGNFEEHPPVVTLPFVYPDGSHDAEALFLDALGNPCVVTKVATGPAGVYCYPPPQQVDVPVVLELVGTLEPPIGVAMITAADRSFRGLLVRTYTNVLFWPPARDVASQLGQTPCILPPPPDVQGEAIAWLPDGSGYVTTSEGAGSPIHRVRCF